MAVVRETRERMRVERRGAFLEMEQESNGGLGYHDRNTKKQTTLAVVEGL